MVRTGYLIAAALGSALICEIAEANPKDDILAKVKQLQSAEQLLVASVATQDKNELDRQNDNLFELIKWYKEFGGKNDFLDCGKAFFGLFFFGNGILSQNSAQDYIKSQNYKAQYQAAAPICEKQLGLSPPGKPNLR